jgi:phenylalanyl-tRNA synthetase beta chain
MCRDPKQIKFAPLNRDTEHTAEELMTIFEVSQTIRIQLMIARPTFGTLSTFD